MPRPIKTPAPPVTPGGWLACYRYRLKHEDEMPWSPEDLASRLGVSGDTVRRWEAGRAVPRQADLQHFAEVGGLRPIEFSFLVKAFAAVETEAPPNPDLFRSMAQNLLSDPFPSYLYDSLFNIRAWNSYMDLVHDVPFEKTGTNRLQRLFEPLPPDSRARLTVDSRRENWLREFWFETARLCGSQAYIETISRLSCSAEFSGRWLALGLEFDSSQEKPVGAQNFRVDPVRGVFRASTSTVGMPPSYFRREFVPVDMRAWRAVTRRRTRGEPVITFADRAHWSS